MPIANNTIANVLIELLKGSPAAAAPVPNPLGPDRPMPSGPLPTPRFPQEMMPPEMRPQESATLPGGSFAPQAAPPPPVVAPEADPGNPLMQLLGGGGGGNFREMFRAFGAGAGAGAGMNDNFGAFGAGLGGTTKYYDVKDELAARSAAAGEERQYDRGRDAMKDQRDAERDARDYELRKVAEARAGKTADINNEKTMQEIRREARMNGLTVSQQLELERVAQAAGENIYDPEQRKQIVDSERQRLLEQFGGGKSISDPSLSNTAEVTATGPNGEKMVVRDGAWVPM